MGAVLLSTLTPLMILSNVAPLQFAYRFFLFVSKTEHLKVLRISLKAQAKSYIAAGSLIIPTEHLPLPLKSEYIEIPY